MVKLNFLGPYSWLDMPDAPSLLEAETSRHPGIYLWTIPLAHGHLVYYVGETGRAFRVRMLEHYKEHASGMYHLYDPERFAKGEKISLWPGRYDVGERKTALECIVAYPHLCRAITELTGIYRFLLAPLECDARLRRRIEAAIAAELMCQSDPMGSFQEPGVRYHPRRGSESSLHIDVESAVPILGMPNSLVV